MLVILLGYSLVLGAIFALLSAGILVGGTAAIGYPRPTFLGAFFATFVGYYLSSIVCLFVYPTSYGAVWTPDGFIAAIVSWCGISSMLFWRFLPFQKERISWRFAFGASVACTLPFLLFFKLLWAILGQPI